MSVNKAQPLLEIRNLRAAYEKGKREVLKGVSLTVESGVLSGILGLNGSGKTTLLKAVCGLIPYEADCFLLDGKAVKMLSGRERASFISYVPQKHSIIYPIEVEAAVLMGVNTQLKWYQEPSKEQRQRAEELLCYVGLNGKQKENFLALSEGQKQLVILARALISDGSLLLFDEPDSGLDYENRKGIFERIRQIIGEKQYGGLMTLHDPSYALRYCDNIYLLQNGVVQDKINCRGIGRAEAQKRLRPLYPEIELCSYKGQLLTVG